MAQPKTNAMRILDKASIPYTLYTYEAKDGPVDGVTAAEKIGRSPETVYKTLIAVGHSKTHYCFVIPVRQSLDLKAAARAVGEKSIEMIPVAAIQAVTGYVRGGCSPIGQKKLLKTVVDASCEGLEEMIISAGKIGCQVALVPGDLLGLISAETGELCLGSSL